jgi:uncharacterized repeat protein (TIGR01451 family)
MRARTLPYTAALMMLGYVACSTDVSEPDPTGVRPAFDVSAQQGADLAITKRADRRNMKIGQNVTFTITVKNRGPSVATNVVFGDPVPDPLNFLSFSCSHGTPHGGPFCAVAEIPVGASVRATLVATPVPNPAAEELRFSNTAFIVESGVADPNTSNNTASVKLHIIVRKPH